MSKKLEELTERKFKIKNDMSKLTRKYEEVRELIRKQDLEDNAEKRAIALAKSIDNRTGKVRIILRRNADLRKMLALMYRKNEEKLDYKAIADELNVSERAAKGLVKIAVHRIIEPVLRELDY